jgi:hypothetical protein
MLSVVNDSSIALASFFHYKTIHARKITQDKKALKPPVTRSSNALLLQIK